MEELLKLCRVSKDLYNQALYVCIQAMKQDEPKFLNYYDLDKILKKTYNLEGTINYRLLKAQVSQQTLKLVATAMKSYFNAIKNYKHHTDKYTGQPKMPNYLPHNGYFLITYTNQCCAIRNGYLVLSKNLKIRVPQFHKYEKELSEFQQVRIIPKKTYMKVEVVYEQNDTISLLDKSRYASIDLGLNNLVTMVTNFSEPIIYNGKQIKALNRYFNKAIAKYRSLLETNNGKKSSNRIERICASRNNRIDDLMHKISRHIVNTLEQNNVGTLVCGRNKGWKDSINLGQRTNQNFVQIPHKSLISMLRYKCEMAGIRFIENEESYTSKCDALALEPVCKHESYMGKRVHRGLFQSSTGRTLNADVNGALNILRKVVGDSCVSRIADSGWLFQPLKLNNLYCLSSEIVFQEF
jgi:putative transposase